jgi:glyoxylase-like metal-dependent hydrolase (beta-lactamase superfamily II)
MPTEDHVGDVVAKERFHRNIAAEAVATAAGLTVDELAAFEEGGEAARPVNYDAVAGLLGMNADKLKGIANGWEPTPPDLARWPGLRQIVSEDSFAVNAYLAWDVATKEAAIFDTGWNADGILKLNEDEKLNPTHLFITHSHHDHNAGMQALRDKFPRIRLHTDAKSTPVQHHNRRNDCVHVGSLRVTNRVTSGHAEDGVTYVVGNWPEDAPFVAIVGDAIFAGSMGKGKISADDAKRWVRESIFTLPASTLICPGHGPFTTVAEEKANNPFF